MKIALAYDAILLSYRVTKSRLQRTAEIDVFSPRFVCFLMRACMCLCVSCCCWRLCLFSCHCLSVPGWSQDTHTRVAFLHAMRASHQADIRGWEDQTVSCGRSRDRLDFRLSPQNLRNLKVIKSFAYFATLGPPEAAPVTLMSQLWKP